MTTRDKDQLLACPFCGGEAMSIADWSWHEGEESHMVACKFCGGNVYCDNEAEAITAWNTRTPRSVSGVSEEELVERVAKAICDAVSGVWEVSATSAEQRLVDLEQMSSTLLGVSNAHWHGIARAALQAVLLVGEESS